MGERYKAHIKVYLHRENCANVLMDEIKKLENDFNMEQDIVDLMIAVPSEFYEALRTFNSKWCNAEETNLLVQIANAFSNELVTGQSENIRDLVYCSSHRILFLMSKTIRLLRGFIIDNIVEQQARKWIIERINNTNEAITQAQSNMVESISNELRKARAIYLGRAEYVSHPVSSPLPSSSSTRNAIINPSPSIVSVYDVGSDGVLESFLAINDSDSDSDNIQALGNRNTIGEAMDTKEGGEEEQKEGKQQRDIQISKEEATYSLIDNVFKYLHTFYEQMTDIYQREMLNIYFFLDGIFTTKSSEYIPQPNHCSTSYKSSCTSSRIFCIEASMKSKDQVTEAEYSFLERYSTMISELVLETDMEIQKDNESLDVKKIAGIIEENEKSDNLFDTLFIKLCQYYFIKFCVDRTRL